MRRGKPKALISKKKSFKQVQLLFCEILLRWAHYALCIISYLPCTLLELVYSVGFSEHPICQTPAPNKLARAFPSDLKSRSQHGCIRFPDQAHNELAAWLVAYGMMAAYENL